MRRRWYREMLDEMRADNRLRREELAAIRGEQRERLGAIRQEQRERLGEIREEQQRAALEQRRRFHSIDAAMENDRRVTREMILELRQQTAMIRDMRHGIQANTEGLLRVLDEFRRSDGPSTAGA
jgi:hypothetical protein